MTVFKIFAVLTFALYMMSKILASFKDPNPFSDQTWLVIAMVICHLGWQIMTIPTAIAFAVML